MSDRTNLNASSSPIKYILGSILFLTLSGIGIFWQIENNNEIKKSKDNTAKAVITATPTQIVLATPTEIIEKAKEGEFCGAGPKGVIECETDLRCDESENIKKENGIEGEIIGRGGICVKDTTITPTITVSPAIKTVENYVNNDDGFSVAYNSARKLYIENEDSGKRYIFYSYSGNITVHAGKTWSWINSGRIFTDKLLIDGEKSYVYEISNQKIVDIEKNNKKYTIQCVHNAKKELITECEEFLNNFKFI